MKKVLPLIILILLVSLIPSCRVTSSLNFDDGSSGSASSAFSTTPFFEGVLEDLSSWKDSGANDPVMDVAVSSFEQNLVSSRYAQHVRISKTGEHTYTAFFSFSDFNALVEDLSAEQKDQDLLVLKNNGSSSRFELKLNLENYSVLSSVLPFLAEPNFEVWGPVYNNPPYDYLTEEDYKDLVSFVLGEDGPQSIDSSVIEIRVSTAQSIKDTNGELLSPTEVLFSFPLIDFLLLHEEILFYCEF